MATHTIHLPRGQWTYDDAQPLGKEGGFGEVFRGKNSGHEVAVKRLKLTASQAAHRELDIAAHLITKKLTRIVPVLDAGQDAQSDRYFLVMPVCDRSLQEVISKTNGGMCRDEAIVVIRSILDGLAEVMEITHRDLKPSNVLLHDGIWKIADFGIAKFVEDSTSTQTLRRSLTPIYAAPEQWIGDRPTGATDIYALGCIVFALFTGEPPFSGSRPELQEKHLHEIPGRIDVLPSREAAFVSYMLRKVPAARPSLRRCIEVFSTSAVGEARSSPPAVTVLAKAAAEIAEQEALAESELQLASMRQKHREALALDARTALIHLRLGLFNTVQDLFEGTTIRDEGRTLAHGELIFKIPEKFSATQRNSTEGWEVICASSIMVLQSRTPMKIHRWSASLFYGGPNGSDREYRWYEVAFTKVYWTTDFSWRPVHFDTEDAIERELNGNSKDVAYGPVPIDAEDEESFFHRWCALLGNAARGRLEFASRAPIVLDNLVR